MTPAQLDVLVRVHVDMHSESGGAATPRTSTNPAADLAALAAL